MVAVLAVGLRLWQPDLAPLRYDDVDVLSRSRDVLVSGPTLTGPLTSWGIPDPPGSVYLMLPPALLPSPAVAAVVWVGLLNVGAVMLTYLLALRHYGLGVAVAASVLFAVNPWAVYFSRRSWAEIVPLFTVLALWAAHEVVLSRRARWAVLFFVALAVQVQIRILSLVYGPAALLSILFWPWRWGVRWPAAGIGLGVLLTVPYLSYVATHWTELMAHLAAGDRGVALAPRGAAAELVLWTGAGFALLPATSDVAPWLDGLGQAGRGAILLVGLLLAIGLAMAVLAGVRRWPGWEALALSALWLVLPVIALVVQSSSIYLHYLVALFPALFLVIALPLGWLLERRTFASVGLASLALAGLLSYQLAVTGVLYRVMESYDLQEPPTAPLALRLAAAGIPREASELLGTGERYGVEVPIRYWQAIASRAATEARAAERQQVWVLTGDTDPLIAEVPALLDYLLRPGVEPRFLPADTLLFRMLYPTVVVELPGVDPIESLERFGERRASFASPSNNRDGFARSRITLVPARGPQAWQGLAPSRVNVRFEDSVRLLGYRVEKNVRAGDDLAVTTVWWLAGESPPTPVVALRMVDEAGTQVRSEQPDRALPPVDEGDWVVIRRDVFSVPARTAPKEYTLEASILDTNGRVLRRVDAEGTSAQLTSIRVSAR